MGKSKSVGVVGGGLIGMSWASLFCAKGCSVVVVDPDPAASHRLRDFLTDAWPNLSALGLTLHDTPSEPIVTEDYSALRNVDFVQENSPEDLET
ncbi:3-hydroxyacyl-CoA dehydrogenase NAD-binding domain-containing protein, partial [Aestuariicoccus sp. MJ-SS9]|uniref:3-hydroxyacyl-CoA dehydrogenase NAD-binding domain-containing protein n=1 Tax=Aestuariicoccus sp. MJ-SS9 TaxID=3079855 RepID=UPI0029077D57